MIDQAPRPWRRFRRRALMAAGAGLAIPGLAGAQGPRGAGTWPERPVSLVVGFPPGGQTDLAARVLQNALQATLGQPVPIDNRAGAGGNIAVEQVLRARPDGYTLSVGNVGTFVLNPHTMPDMTFDPLDLVPIGLMLQSPLLLMVHSGIPVHSFPEWLAWMRRQQPTGIDFGTTSAGGIGHATAEKLRARLGGDPVFNMIHYRGSGPALQDFIGGRYSGLRSRLNAIRCSPRRSRVNLRRPRSGRLHGLRNCPRRPPMGQGTPHRLQDAAAGIAPTTDRVP